MHGAAPLAAPELEHRGRAVGADLAPGQCHVRPARAPGVTREAGERALGGAGEQVVARGQHRRARGVPGRRAERDQFRQPGPGDPRGLGQVGEQARPVGEQRADPAEAGGVGRPEVGGVLDRAVRHRHPGSLDEVLAGRVARTPLERGVEQLRGELHDGRRAVADGGGRRDGLQRAGGVLFPGEDLLLEPA